MVIHTYWYQLLQLPIIQTNIHVVQQFNDKCERDYLWSRKNMRPQAIPPFLQDDCLRDSNTVEPSAKPAGQRSQR